ncbi:low affinity iron permease family protein [Kaistia soli]|uniref:low affinity iron permease family protein n=1 Tax=Kaistia soli TaxID=446684 RepID=UPI00313CD516
MCVAGVVLWAISGPFFGFSETWQLVINTSTTIITSGTRTAASALRGYGSSRVSSGRKGQAGAPRPWTRRLDVSAQTVRRRRLSRAITIVVSSPNSRMPRRRATTA